METEHAADFYNAIKTLSSFSTAASQSSISESPLIQSCLKNTNRYIEAVNKAKNITEKFYTSNISKAILSRLVEIKVLTKEDEDWILNVKKYLGHVQLNSLESSTFENQAKLSIRQSIKTLNLYNNKWYPQYMAIQKKIQDLFSKYEQKHNVSIEGVIITCLDTLVSESIKGYFPIPYIPILQLLEPADKIKNLQKIIENLNQDNLEDVNSEMTNFSSTIKKLAKQLEKRVLIYSNAFECAGTLLEKYLVENYKSSISDLESFTQHTITNFTSISTSTIETAENLLKKIKEKPNVEDDGLVRSLSSSSPQPN